MCPGLNSSGLGFPPGIPPIYEINNSLETEEHIDIPRGVIKDTFPTAQLLSLVSRSVVRDVYVEGKEHGETPTDGFLSKFVPPELKVAVGIPASQLDSRIDDFTGFSKDGIVQKPGRNALVERIITSNFSADDLKCREILPFLKSREEISADIKYQLVKEIQCFGQKYEKIFKLLEGVQGPIEIKKQFFESNIKEAARYIRGDLIENLEKKLEEMTSGYLSKKEHQTLNA
uniref:INTS6/SAGE1/DDX26B/CT45 C-terminal domain-containing protein n=1 Tax=Callithrix jacchus TaxID=9483 RepID=A0A8I3W7J6_CALJA